MQKHKTTVTLLRWVMFLALAYLTLASDGTITPLQAALLAIVAASNIVLARLREVTWEHPALLPTVALLDIAVLTASMLGGQGFARDFFFAYFLVLALVALAGGLRVSAVGTGVVVLGYGAFLSLQVGAVLFQTPELIGRLGFLFSVGVGYAGLMEASRARLNESAMQGQLVGWVGKLGDAFSEDFDAIEVIHEVLVDIQRVYPGSTRASLVHLHDDVVQVIASGDDVGVRDRELSADRYPELLEVVESQAPVIINDIRTSKSTETVRELVGNLPFNSLLLYPVDLQDDSMGHVVLRVARKHGVFTPGMAATTEHVAKAIGVIFRQGKLREAVERSEKMEMVSQITNSVAHSFNGILSTVLLSSEHLRKQAAQHREISTCAASPCDAASMQRFESIELAVKEGLTIVERLSAWTRLGQDSSSETTTGSAIDPAKLLEEAWSYAQPQWKRRESTRDLDLVWEISPAPPIEGNRAELREVLLNMIVNAIDAMPKGGTLTLGVEGGHDRVRFRIEDTGIGISEEHLARVFEPLFSTKGTAGTGLGLSVARSVVQRHEGDIQVHSEEGVGTRFTLLLPASEALGSGDIAVEEDGSAENPGGRFLLVEHSELVRDVMVRFLQSTGVDVDVVATTDEAEIMLGTQRNYSAVLADAGATVEETATFVEAVYASRPDLGHRLLFYSTHAPNERFRELQREHGFHFVDRSAGLAALREAIAVPAGVIADTAGDHGEAAA